MIIQSEDAKTYYHGHDVFEELVVNHIFTEQYKNNIPEKEFLNNLGHHYALGSCSADG